MRFSFKSDFSFYFACWLVVFGERQRAVITCTEEYSNCIYVYIYIINIIVCVYICMYIFIEGGRTIVGEDKTSQRAYIHSLYSC